MRTRLLTAALTTLLTIGSTGVAFAQAADTIAAHRQAMAEADQRSGYSAPENDAVATATQHHTYDGNVVSTGSAHQQPQG